jgi:hypothetical protein
MRITDLGLDYNPCSLKSSKSSIRFFPVNSRYEIFTTRPGYLHTES